MANEKYMRVLDFSGGLDDSTAAHLLADNESPDLVNLWPLKRYGSLVKRNGFAKLNTNVLASAAITGITKYYKAAGTQWVVAACANNLYSITDTGTSADIFTGTMTGNGVETFFLTLNDTLYIVNGNATDLFMKWDGSTAVTAANATGPLDGAVKIPLRYIFYHEMWQRVIVIGSSTYGSQAHYSAINNAESWAGYEVFTPEDGDSLVCGCSCSSRAIFFKRRSIHSMYGSSPSEVSQSRIYADYGTESPRSVIADGDIVYFFGTDGAFHALSGNRPVDIGNKVKVTTQAINKTMRTKVAGCKYYDYILWSYSDNGSYNNKVLVYDTRTGVWSRFQGISANCWHTNIGAADEYQAVFGGSVSTSGRTYTFDTTTADDGANIYWCWLSPTLSPGLGWPFVADTRLLFLLAKLDDGVINYQISADQSARQVSGQFAFVASGAVYGGGATYGDGTVYGGGDFVKKWVPVPLKGSEFRVLLSGNDQKALEIRKLALSYNQTVGEAWATT